VNTLTNTDTSAKPNDNVTQRYSVLLTRLVITLCCLTAAFATTIDFKSPIVAFSADKNYKFEVLPPQFQNNISYGFFQAEDFLHLTHSESAEGARRASVTGNLYQKQNGAYVLLWSRPLVSTIIPSRAFVLGTETDMIAGIDGQRTEAPASTSTYFSLYGFNGACITNGFYRPSQTNTWSLTNQVVELKNQDGLIKLKINLK
jgi:hypothetical protein